jgi:hypothetical protein
VSDGGKEIDIVSGDGDGLRFVESQIHLGDETGTVETRIRELARDIVYGSGDSQSEPRTNKY